MVTVTYTTKHVVFQMLRSALHSISVLFRSFPGYSKNTTTGVF